MVTCREPNGFALAVDFQLGFAFHNQYPLIPTLLIPEPRRADLATGHNALDTQTGNGQQIIKGFTILRSCRRQIEKIVLALHANPDP